MDTLQELTIQSIKSHAETGIKLESLGLAVTNMRDDHKEIMHCITEILKKLAAIEVVLHHNDEEHTAIYRRIDNDSDRLDGLIKDHSPCRSLSKAATENNDKHAVLHKRIDSLSDTCKNCPATSYKDLADQVKAMKTTLDELCKSLAVFSYKIKEFPVWLVLVAMVLVGFAFDVANHVEWVLRIIK